MTLDISAAADYNKLRPKKKRKPNPPPPEAPQPTALPGAQDGAGPPGTPIPETPAPIDIDPALEQAEEDPSSSEPEDRIQILDLHTHNPLISYQNQLYSCEWTSTLGTDVILTAPQPDFPHPVLRERPNVSVLAASSIKLMGRPAQIASRQSGEEGGQASKSAPDTSIDSTHPAAPGEPPPVKIPLGETPSLARQTQANFLERLIAIKAKKGEKDNVTVYVQKVNQGSGWRTQRKASEVFEDDGEDEPAPKQSTRQRGSGGRPRGSRRTNGPRTAKGGLFRDYRPQLWDTPGADIRAGSSSTPDSWSRLEEGGASDGRRTPRITNASASSTPADQPLQPANKSTGSLSASARAIASPTPPSPLAQSTNIQGTTPIENAASSPSLAPPSGPQPPDIVTQDSGAAATAAASGVPDIEMEEI